VCPRTPRSPLFPYTTPFRSGRDAALSLLERSWGPDTIPDAAAAWKEGIEKARRQAKRKLPDDAYVEVRYEELVREPEATLREVADRKSTRLNSSHVKSSYAV